jgi:cytochrome P450 family 142 subfamily A polypeptide 1
MDLKIEFLASQNWDENMEERLAWLRENEPVYWSDKDQLWVVTSFEDVSYVSKHQELFTSAAGVRPGNPAKLGLIDEDEPRHTDLRKLINKGFSPRMVKKLESVFRDITTEAIDAVAKDGECDFVSAISVPLPIRLIAAMIGICEEDRDLFHRWSDEMIAADGNQSDPEIMQRAHKAFLEYSAYVTRVIEDRRKNPQDDLTSILVGAKDEGLLGDFGGSELPLREDVSEEHLALANDELIMLMVILMVAGNETTRNGISGGMQLLIENPEERQKLIDDPSRIPAAVEEMVRMVSPVRSFGRTATQDTELRGKSISKGEKVLIVYPSANRDPKEFADPDRFDVARNPHHLGFGIGSHFCLGANLARMEMRVAFEEVLRRLPDMEYSDGGPQLKPSALVRSCMEMRVRFTPETQERVG